MPGPDKIIGKLAFTVKSREVDPLPEMELDFVSDKLERQLLDPPNWYVLSLHFQVQQARKKYPQMNLPFQTIPLERIGNVGKIDDFDSVVFELFAEAFDVEVKECSATLVFNDTGRTFLLRPKNLSHFPIIFTNLPPQSAQR